MILLCWCLGVFCRWLGSLSFLSLVYLCLYFFHLRRLSLVCPFSWLRAFSALHFCWFALDFYLVRVCRSFGSRFASVYLMGVWWNDLRLAPIRALLSMVLYMNRILLAPLKKTRKRIKGQQCWTSIDLRHVCKADQITSPSGSVPILSQISLVAWSWKKQLLSTHIAELLSLGSTSMRGFWSHAAFAS